MKLTPRELEVLTLMKEGFTNRDIADALECSIGTVKTHVRSIYREYGVKSAAWAPKGERCVKLERLQ